MITYKKGDMFAEDVEALVNPVNCVGVMGMGLALEFKKRFPENFKMYKEVCVKEQLSPGGLHVYGLLESANIGTDCSVNPKYIINFPTKMHWMHNSKRMDIISSLHKLKEWIEQNKIKSIAIPALGCGLGGLDWDDVKLDITMLLENANCEIVVFEPN